MDERNFTPAISARQQQQQHQRGSSSHDYYRRDYHHDFYGTGVAVLVTEETQTCNSDTWRSENLFILIEEPAGAASCFESSSAASNGLGAAQVNAEIHRSP